MNLYEKRIWIETMEIKYTVVPVVEETFVEHLQVLGIPGEGEAVSGHGVPRSNGQQSAILVLRHQIVEDRSIVDERVHLSVGENDVGQKIEKLETARFILERRSFFSYLDTSSLSLPRSRNFF